MARRKTGRILRWGLFVLTQLWTAFITVSDTIAHHSTWATPAIMILLWLVWWMMLWTETDWYKRRTGRISS